MPYAILTVVLVALDQIVKYFVLKNIGMWEYVPFIPHILSLTYVRNTGAAFSLFEEHTWILALVSAAACVLLILAIRKNFFPHWLGKLCLTLVLGGAIGNLIDRVLRGYVVDMFNVLFMNFAVFNVADIFVVVGGIGAALYYLFLDPKMDHREEKHDEADADR